MTATAQQAVDHFASLKGVHEHPIGSNNVPGITDFLHTPGGATTGPCAWCACTVSRVLFDIGIHDLCNANAFGGWANGCAYVPYVTHRFRGGPQWIERGHEHAGDLPIFVWGGAGSNRDGDHIGMCIKPGEFSWEGNAHGPDGYDEVAQHQRAESLILGFVRPTYGKVQPPAPPRPAPIIVPPAVTGEPHYSHALFLTSPHLMVGTAVTQWQTKMHRRGWGAVIGRIDGIFGPRCAQAAAAFQRDCDAHHWYVGRVDGIVGPLTWHATWARPVS